MKITKPRKEFKDKFGNANHYLITALVGLNAIEKGQVISKESSFSTSWNPRDTMVSARRTRVFILRSFLVMAVESLEMYLTTLNRKPKLLQSDTFLKIYSKAGQSIYEKVIRLGDEIQIDPILVGLMEVLITWRNYIAHFDVDNEIRKQSWDILISNSETIKQRFKGLDIAKLKNTWENNGDFTFKETASLIQAVQLFVESFDQYVLNNLNLETYITEVLEKYFSDKVVGQRFKSSNNKSKYLIQVIEQRVGIVNYEVKKELIDFAISCANKVIGVAIKK